MPPSPWGDGARRADEGRFPAFAQLVEELADIGVDEKGVNIRNKLSRGKFSAAFMLACLEAIGTDNLHL
ncbi:MAG: hypothetical protein CMF73_02990 [Maricaulis sp.]|nr:hypothetical protein [Maricaulis sp.]